jgi:2-dehydropantoate 2-reductase
MSQAADTCEFAILGAGALGSILGAHLARAGHRVSMLARGERAAHIRAHGLRIRGLADLQQFVGVVSEPPRLQQARVLIVAMKTPGTAAALAQLQHLRPELAFSVQNGVIKDELLVRVFGSGCVLGAAANTSGELLPGGEVVFTRNENLLLGELRGACSERAADLAARLADAGIRTTATNDLLSVEWSKFVAWVGLVVLSLLTRAPTPVYLTDPGCARVLVRLAREVGALATALGIRLTDGAVLPAATLCHAPEEQAIAAVLAVGQSFAAQAPGHRMSSLQDLSAGRPLEIHETLGYALQRSHELSVAAPLLEACYGLVSVLDRKAGRLA